MPSVALPCFLVAIILSACGYLFYQSSLALIEVTTLNNSATSGETDTSDEIALKMRFGDKEQSLLDMLIYSLKDHSFVVGNNSRICPEQNCNFEFKDTDLVYQPGSNRITMDGNMKVKSGDVTKINEFNMDIQPTEARENEGDKTEIVRGTFSVGPFGDAEFEYNVNGTLESQKGEKTLSLQGVECNGINNDDSKPIDCNY